MTHNIIHGTADKPAQILGTETAGRQGVFGICILVYLLLPKKIVFGKGGFFIAKNDSVSGGQHGTAGRRHCSAGGGLAVDVRMGGSLCGMAAGTGHVRHGHDTAYAGF